MRGYDSILFDMTSQARNNYKMIEDILNRPEMKKLDKTLIFCFNVRALEMNMLK